VAAKDYRVVLAGTHMSGADDVNKFTTNNPDWTLFNVIPVNPTHLAFVFERPKKDGPTTTPPTGGTEAAVLSENVVAFRKAA
jgi:hypothetical protein